MPKRRFFEGGFGGQSNTKFGGLWAPIPRKFVKSGLQALRSAQSSPCLIRWQGPLLLGWWGFLAGTMYGKLYASPYFTQRYEARQIVA